MLPAASPVVGQGYNSQSAGAEWSLATFSGYVRFEVRPGDHWAQDVTNGNGYVIGIHERSELAAFVPMGLDTDIWVSYAIRISPNSGPTTYSGSDGSQFCILGQLHSTGSPNPAIPNPLPFVQSLLPDGTTVQVLTRSSLSSNPNIPITQFTYSIGDGQWHRLVHHLVLYNATGTGPGTGKLETWLDGTNIFSEDGIQMGSAQTNGPEWKMGVYRSASTKGIIADYANFESISGTSLLGRVTSPLAIPGL